MRHTQQIGGTLVGWEIWERKWTRPETRKSSLRGHRQDGSRKCVLVSAQLSFYYSNTWYPNKRDYLIIKGPRFIGKATFTWWCVSSTRSQLVFKSGRLKSRFKVSQIGRGRGFDQIYWKVLIDTWLSKPFPSLCNL